MLFLSFGTVNAELIPSDRLATWIPGNTVGVSGGIPTTRTIFTNLTNIDKTGATDVHDAIQAAINACPANQVVLLPPGKFLVNGSLSLRPGITLRGSGMDSTVITNYGGLIFAADNSFFRIYQEGPYQSQTISGGLAKGSTNIFLTNTVAYTVGSLVEIAQFISTNQYDNPLITGTGARTNQYNYLYRVIARITGVTPTSITIWPPLYGDMSARQARIAAGYFTYSGLGVEDFSLYLGGTTIFGIQLGGIRDSWVKGVKVRNASNYSLNLFDSANMEVRDCNLEDLNHSGSNGAGLLLNTVCSSLFENNVIINSAPDIEINAGSCGNVFGYNFLLNTNGAIAIDSNHGPHNAYNLFEGNVASTHLSDGYFGSESDGTVFRNWYHGQFTSSGNSIGWAFSLKRFTRRYNLVGNILGAGSPYTMTYDGTSFGQPNMGNSMFSGYAPPWKDWDNPTGVTGFQELDTNVLATLIRKGNYNYFNKAIPTSESLGADTLPNSLYRNTKPLWFANLAWPPFDPTNPRPTYDAIPAGYRYLYKTNPPPTAGGTSPTAPSNLRVTPN